MGQSASELPSTGKSMFQLFMLSPFLFAVKHYTSNISRLGTDACLLNSYQVDHHQCLFGHSQHFISWSDKEH